MKLSNLVLPDAVDLKNYESSVETSSTRCESNVVRPTSFSDNQGKGQFTFVIPPLGIIHDCMLTFAAETTAARDNLNLYPASTGLTSMIEEISLSIGGAKICSVSGFQDRFASMRCFTDMEKRRYYDSYKYGTSDYYEVKINSAGNSNNGVGFPNSVFPDYIKIRDQVANPNGSSSFRLNLKDMFEFFNTNFDLPAYLLDSDQKIILSVKLTNETTIGDRVVVNANAPTLTTNFTKIERDSCRLYVENVFLDESKMSQIAEIYRGGQVLQYRDIETTKSSLLSPGANVYTDKNTFTINGAGKAITGVNFCIKPTADIKTNAQLHTLGSYKSNSYDRTGFNIQVNNKNVLNSNSENMQLGEVAALYSTLHESNDYLDMPKGLLDFLFGDNGGISDTLTNSSSAANNGRRKQYAGLCAYYGLSFGPNGVSVSNVAPTLEIARNNTTTQANMGNATIVAFVEVIRYFSLRNGRVNITY